MKLVQSSVVVVLFAVSSNGQWDTGGNCEDCVENADIFQNCVKDYCVDADGSYGESKEYCLAQPLYTDMEDLADCCLMSDRSGSNECVDAGEHINGCLTDCLPECVEDTIYNYMDCYSKHISIESGCELGDCITKIALDKEWLGDELNNEDEFFKALEESLQQGSASDKLECDGAEEKAAEVCNIGKSCCDNCNPKLGEMMDCIVNTVVRPWQIMKFEKNPDDYSDCETECDRLGVDRRDLAEDESASLTGDAAQDKAIREQSVIAAKPCLDNMRSTIAVSGNMTAIGPDTINCVVVESARVLQTDDTTKPAATVSSATSVAAASIASAFLAAAAAAAV